LKLFTSIIILVGLLSLTACPGTPHVNSTAPLGDSLTRTQVYGEQAHGLVKQSIPHSDSTGQVLLGGADSALTKQAAEFQNAQKMVATLNDQIGALTKTNIEQATTIKAYRSRWTGDMFIAALKWVIASLIAMALAYGVLSVYAAGNPVLGLFARAIAALFTGGLSEVKAVGGWIASKISGKKVVTTVAPAAA